MSDLVRRTLMSGTPDVPALPHQEVATLLVTVKAYPAIGSKTGEAVCVAGVRIDDEVPEWARLFPVKFRQLPETKQFEKYQAIRLRVDRSPSDRRPESLRPNLDSMQLGPALDSSRGWRDRTAVIAPLIGATTACALLGGTRETKGSAPSLGLIKPTVTDLVVELNSAFQRRDHEAAQSDLFGHEINPLEASPVIARFHYRCQESGCKGHDQSLVDWESGRLARRNMKRGVAEMIRLHKERFLDEICGPGRDAHFYVGNMHHYPENFLVLGVWSPPAASATQLELDL